MNTFRFHNGASWVVAHQDGIEEKDGQPMLKDPSKAMTGESAVGRAVPLFTNIELAERFANDAREPEYAAAGIEGGQSLLDFLEAQRDSGTAQVLPNPIYGRELNQATPIEKVIANVRESLK